MTMLSTFRSAVQRRAAYLRTKREIANLPVEFAVEDLGIYPGDAEKIAAKAVYG